MRLCLDHELLFSVQFYEIQVHFRNQELIFFFIFCASIAGRCVDQNSLDVAFIGELLLVASYVAKVFTRVLK